MTPETDHATPEWKVGDIVVIKPSLADTFLQPLRRFAQEGRRAEIISVPPISKERYCMPANPRVRFTHKKGIPSNFEFTLSPNHIQKVEQK